MPPSKPLVVQRTVTIDVTIEGRTWTRSVDRIGTTANAALKLAAGECGLAERLLTELGIEAKLRARS